jgi:hypothetical protein
MKRCRAGNRTLDGQAVPVSASRAYAPTHAEKVAFGGRRVALLEKVRRKHEHAAGGRPGDTNEAQGSAIVPAEKRYRGACVHAGHHRVSRSAPTCRAASIASSVMLVTPVPIMSAIPVAPVPSGQVWSVKAKPVASPACRVTSSRLKG